MSFRCPDSQCGFTSQTLPADDLCPKCWRELVEVHAPSGRSRTVRRVSQQIGVCAMICDVSLTMLDPVPEMAEEGAPAADIPKRIELLATNAAHGIWDLCDGISKPDDTFIAVIAFGEKAGLLPMPDGRPFLASASSIIEVFNDVDTLEEFLIRRFDDFIERWGTGTNISAGLNLAKSIYDGLLQNDLSDFGGPVAVKPVQHSIVRPDHSEVIVPNFRALIFSDGKHNRGALVNSFAEGETSSSPWSLLMTAFIGNHDDPAVAQLKSLAGVCPYHARLNFFLINDRQRFQQLRGLFKMASGSSGFCPVCLGEY